MFPLHSAPTRLGIEQGLRGEAHRGPGCYEKDVVSTMQCKIYSSLSFLFAPMLKLKFLSYCFQMMLFLQPMDRRPRSSNGWYFGATSGPRLHRERDVSACWLARVTGHDNGVWSCRISCRDRLTTLVRRRI